MKLIRFKKTIQLVGTFCLTLFSTSLMATQQNDRFKEIEFFEGSNACAKVTDFCKYKEVAKLEGYELLLKKDSISAIISLVKPIKSEKKHGLFGIRWKEQEEILLTFHPLREDIYSLTKSSGKVTTKAPFLGSWRVIENSQVILPEELIVLCMRGIGQLKILGP